MPFDRLTFGTPLAGVRVLCLAQQLPGPYAAMLLREMGAEVVMVEQSGGGDPGRRSPSLFEMLNRGKFSVALDLKDDRDRRQLTELARSCRIVLEGFRPGVARRLGVDYETLHAVRKDVIYCAISGYGQSGPQAELPAHDLSIQGRAGVAMPVAFDPHYTGLPLADLTSGLFAAMMTAVCALAGEESRYLDLSMADALVGWASVLHVGDWAGEWNPFRGNANPGYGFYRTSDGWLSISIAFEDHFWQLLCERLGMHGVGGLDRVERHERFEELRAAVAERVAEHSTDHWLDELGTAGVPVDRVNDAESLLADELFLGRGVIRRDGPMPDIRTPLTQFEPQPAARRAPGLGAHNQMFFAHASTTGATDERNER
ncbi:CoA transferase [Rhodococcus sp. T2V]|uniref:CaiB/BaiF CoA transferase family protein n=1 Tax=Rhodococcus sp. T2V TaxID=3034164 RepID=UPI0023E23A44|nr:CoA transferase [Rhodococcus sp. T2V]MDF3312054.1 CoA transferase [Rhodococcus sp. T2V]